MKHFDLSVYFIADPSVCGGREITDVVASAVRGGATMVQLRNKDCSPSKIEAQGCALQEVLKKTDVPLIINDHVEIAARLGANGVHIGQGDMKPEEAREIIGPDAILGLTAFTLEHFMALDPAVVDYAGTGPFSPTLTKPDKSVLGAEKFAQLVKRSPVPVVGIGGLNADNAAEVIHAGAQGVAMMRSVSESPDPAKAARNIKDVIARAYAEA
jgi:thiamine-phosphate pyrophosphorylase